MKHRSWHDKSHTNMDPTIGLQWLDQLSDDHFVLDCALGLVIFPKTEAEHWLIDHGYPLGFAAP